VTRYWEIPAFDQQHNGDESPSNYCLLLQDFTDYGLFTEETIKFGHNVPTAADELQLAEGSCFCLTMRPA
jgi:hypothetical protein